MPTVSPAKKDSGDCLLKTLLSPVLFSFLSVLLLLCGCSRPVYYPIEQPVAPPLEYKPPFPKEMLIKERRSSNQNIIITIDPGHGGEDFGTHSNTPPTYHEKNLNLAISKMLKSYLDKQGYTTVMTRMKDDFIGLDERADFANNQKSALFVSLHFNSAPSKEADGIEVYYYRSTDNKERTERSQQLAKAVLDQVLAQTQAKSRGTKHGNFAVIRQTNMPAVLVEGGFLTNDEEMQKIKDPAYLKKLAWGVALGINDYLEGGRRKAEGGK